MSTEVRRRPALPGGRVLSDGHMLYWWVEILLIIGFYVVYSQIRNLSGNSLEHPPAHALEHAKQIIELEHRLWLFHEHRLQDWAEHFTPLIVAANYFYGSLHFIVTIFAGAFLYRRYSDDYPRFRNALGITTALALIGFTFYPLVPPRLLSFVSHGAVDYGFSDTLDRYPTFWSFNSGGVKSFSNQFAAMPSVHCAWSAWCALALVPRLKSRAWRILALCYPFLTVFVIIITGNHFWLDAVGGWIILAIGWFLSGVVTRASRPRRVPDQLA